MTNQVAMIIDNPIGQENVYATDSSVAQTQSEQICLAESKPVTRRNRGRPQKTDKTEPKKPATRRQRKNVATLLQIQTPTQPQPKTSDSILASLIADHQTKPLIQEEPSGGEAVNFKEYFSDTGIFDLNAEANFDAFIQDLTHNGFADSLAQKINDANTKKLAHSSHNSSFQLVGNNLEDLILFNSNRATKSILSQSLSSSATKKQPQSNSFNSQKESAYAVQDVTQTNTVFGQFNTGQAVATNQQLTIVSLDQHVAQEFYDGTMRGDEDKCVQNSSSGGGGEKEYDEGLGDFDESSQKV